MAGSRKKSISLAGGEDKGGTQERCGVNLWHVSQKGRPPLI